MRHQIIQRLQTERSFGVEFIPRAKAADNASGTEKAQQLATLYEKFKNCQACDLASGRTHLVFGSGNPEAQLMFIGEAPGYDEDQSGLPFVGAAGQLLTKMIQAMKLRREDVYIANCLKCRPPGNRNPMPTEIASCNPILMQQIDIIQPKVICTLGKFASQTLLQTQEPISRLRGRFHDWKNIRVMPTFHPAYLLRTPEDKKIAWQDLQMVMNELGVL